MNNKSIYKTKLYIFTFLTIVSIVSLIPLLRYNFNFKLQKVSGNPTDWGTYGDYISGTVGVLLSFFAATLSLISIYLTIKSANDIKDKEFKIIQIQNKPLPYLNLTKYDNLTRIELQNMGPGSLIVTEIELVYSKDMNETTKTYRNFKELLTGENILFPKSVKDDYTELKIYYDTAPNYILATAGSKRLFEIIFTKGGDVNGYFDNNENNEEKNSFIRNNDKVKQSIGNYTFKIKYTDIFNIESFYFEKDLSFFLS